MRPFAGLACWCSKRNYRRCQQGHQSRVVRSSDTLELQLLHLCRRFELPATYRALRCCTSQRSSERSAQPSSLHLYAVDIRRPLSCSYLALQELKATVGSRCMTLSRAAPGNKATWHCTQGSSQASASQTLSPRHLCLVRFNNSYTCTHPILPLRAVRADLGWIAISSCKSAQHNYTPGI